MVSYDGVDLTAEEAVDDCNHCIVRCFQDVGKDCYAFQDCIESSFGECSFSEGL